MLYIHCYRKEVQFPFHATKWGVSGLGLKKGFSFRFLSPGSRRTFVAHPYPKFAGVSPTSGGSN